MNDYTYPILGLILAVVERSLALYAGLHAVLKKRETKAVIGWVGLIFLSPLVGSVLYFMLGVNRIERKGQRILKEIQRATIQATHYTHEQSFPKNFDLQLARVGKSITGFDLLPGNQLTPYNGGTEAYAEMIEAIENANVTIGLCSYIFDYDQAGKRFIDALLAAKNRGVEVRVLVDHVGSRYSKPSAVDIMRDLGIPVATFLPTNAPLLAAYANLRNHRKVMTVDGLIGFTGGMNIREGCMNLPGTLHPIQDLHFKLSGPVVEHLQNAFLADWDFAADEELPEDVWFDVPEAAGTTWARGIPDGPDDSIDSIRLVMFNAITSAQRRIDIVTPYFIPEGDIINALNVAAMRGVKVRILVPDEVNIKAVKWASMDPISKILERGCEVYQSAYPFDHTKVMLVDDTWTLIGSSNWDPRSLRLNFEFNVECYGTELNEQITAIINGKIAVANPLTLEELASRNLFQKVRDGIARMATPYL